MSLTIDDINGIVLTLINDKSFYKLSDSTIEDVNKLVNYLQEDNINKSQAELLLMHIEDDAKKDENIVKLDIHTQKKLELF